MNHYDNYSTRCIADHVPYQWDEAFAYAADPYVIHVVSYDDPTEWGGQKFSEELFFAYETEGNSVVRDDSHARLIGIRYQLIGFQDLLIIPRQKPLCYVLSDPPIRDNESTFPQNESGMSTEVALQPLVC